MNARLLMTAPYRGNVMPTAQREGGGGVEDVGGKWGRVRRQNHHAHGLPAQMKYNLTCFITRHHHVATGPILTLPNVHSAMFKGVPSHSLTREPATQLLRTEVPPAPPTHLPTCASHKL